MNEERFWQLIKSSHSESSNDTNVQLKSLREKLEHFSSDEIISFDKTFAKFHWLSYDWKLWAAAYLINGGCSDDGFDYFRAGLILQGEEVFKAVIFNPESLIDVIKFEDGNLSKGSEWAEGVEEFIYLSSEIYKEKTNEEMQYEFSAPKAPSGENWNEDEVEKVLPNLAKYCEEGMK